MLIVLYLTDIRCLCFQRFDRIPARCMGAAAAQARKVPPRTDGQKVLSRPRHPVAFLYVGRSPSDGSLSALH